MTWRSPTDALNTLQAATHIISRDGAQTDIDRWGDYTQMSVDPVDDFTRFDTSQYMKFDETNDTPNWSTRIAKLKLSNCL